MPVPPLNLIGDYGGGRLYLVVGLLAALHEAQRSGRGQTVDAAITEGVNSLMSFFASGAMRGRFSEQRGAQLLDGGAPFYGVYETSDARYVSIGPLEPQFFADLCERIGIDDALRDAQFDRVRWPALRAALEAIFRTRNRDASTSLLEGTDVCFAPVLALSEAPSHPHQVARRAFVEAGGVRHPAPAPRFSRTPSAIQWPAPTDASTFDDIRRRWLQPD